MTREIPYSPMGQKVSTTTPEQMFQKLEARNADIRERSGQSAQPKLSWGKAVRQPNGAGHQCAEGTLYVVRKTMSKDKWVYGAWHDRKLLDYSHDVEVARNYCETHRLTSMQK
jgi:hypothetical protein